jgi:hypothetical protein
MDLEDSDNEDFVKDLKQDLEDSDNGDSLTADDVKIARDFAKQIITEALSCCIYNDGFRLDYDIPEHLEVVVDELLEKMQDDIEDLLDKKYRMALDAKVPDEQPEEEPEEPTEEEPAEEPGEEQPEEVLESSEDIVAKLLENPSIELITHKQIDHDFIGTCTRSNPGFKFGKCLEGELLKLDDSSNLSVNEVIFSVSHCGTKWIRMILKRSQYVEHAIKEVECFFSVPITREQGSFEDFNYFDKFNMGHFTDVTQVKYRGDLLRSRQLGGLEYKDHVLVLHYGPCRSKRCNLVRKMFSKDLSDIIIDFMTQSWYAYY